ncbi:septum site-determining protein MinC [Ramlibacter sp. AW1]|uniref:Probable septum site-determining protein MinC n=1 Tax=Ramlibacter aurantiacus TaxID=2801330 RepID=A0A936ZJD9_9BURK|nr:septum site-determining protein MinC [Ramlibacter aurantiacus]MBL0421288.1 septum site-determining protein MinC [Ramlibacter aurantiacus]
MTVALASRVPATFEIKSATLPLLSLLLKSHDLSLLAEELQARFGDIPDFFENEPLVVDLTPLVAAPAAQMPDFLALVRLLREYRMLPLAVRGGSAEQMQAAIAAGLAPTTETLLNATRGAEPEASAPAEVQHIEPPPTSALVIDRPLRSGQQVYARGRDLVVTCMVNSGAEVIADGHIHVYAPLRGKAIAGARGDTQARIISLCMEPELISIAGVYRTSDVPLPAEVLSKPTQVRLVGGSEGRLVMDPIA